MTKAQAYRILEVDQYTGQEEIKKKYRKLMHRVHPDANMEKESMYLYTAQEINEAYALLRNKSKVQRTNRQKKQASNSRTKQIQWDAPLNQRAYTWRNVYHYAEDYDGEIMGDFVIASGKYLWKTEEDFPLFLKSMFECSQRLLQEIEAETGWERSTSCKMKIQGELAYLLAQQFIDGAGTLGKLANPIPSEEANIYHIAAMLEVADEAPVLRVKMPLYPLVVRNHRLFLQTGSCKTAGYLSFRDDRLYYIVIPLLEHRRAQVKIGISEKQDRRNSRNPHRYKNLDFALKIPLHQEETFPESINLQIEELLRTYYKEK